MRLLISAALMISTLLLAPAVADDRSPPFELPGVCSIDVPGPGFEWKVVKKLDGKSKGAVCMAKDSAATAVVVMIVEERASPQGNVRIATIGAHWDALAALKAKGYTDVREQPPTFALPIPETARYGLDAKTKDGTPAFVRGATVFRKNTYAFQVFSKKKDDAEKALDVLKTLKEPK
jgi:hypothetical protein